MSEISQLLREQSEHINDQLQKQAEAYEFISRTQQSAVDSLVESGMSAEAAEELVKSAEEFEGIYPKEYSVDAKFAKTVFEKAAQYIESLEKELQDSQAKIRDSEELSKVAQLGPVADSLQNIGFSKDQVNILAQANMIEKVAHLVGSPWEPGESSGRPSADTMDPIERFCFGGR